MASCVRFGVQTPQQNRIDQFMKVGVTHFLIGVSAPFDHAAIRRFAEQIHRQVVKRKQEIFTAG